MSVLHHHNGGGTVAQSRQAWGSYRLPIEARAATAVDLLESGGGLSAKDVAARLCVNRHYIWLAQQLSFEDLIRLGLGELKLAQLHRDYVQRLAERRAQRGQAEREATTETAEPVRERVKRFANGGSVPGLSDNAIENIVREVGVDRIWKAVDRLTQPSLPVAVAAE